MKKSIIVSLSAAAVIMILAFVKGGEKYETLKLGAKAPKTDVKMMDISGESYSLDDLKKENGLLVMFSCNTCPFVIKWEDRYPGVETMCDNNKVGMVLVNSNEAKRSNADSMSEMKDHAKQNNYRSKYVVDEKSLLANSFGAKTTPHVFLFDKDMKLVYKGSIDDNVESASMVKEKYLENAMKNMVAGKKIDPASTKAIGCSIKRVPVN